MTDPFLFEWDEAKRIRNIVEHGIDFVEGIAVFDDPKVSIVPDARKDYGEERYNAYGMSNGRHLRVCFTVRGIDVIRIISIFKVHQKEWDRHYGNS